VFDFDIERMCGDTIDSDKVATVDGNTNDAKRNVNGKSEEVSYPCPRYDVKSTLLLSLRIAAK
jgi:hypothetical protein